MKDLLRIKFQFHPGSTIRKGNFKLSISSLWSWKTSSRWTKLDSRKRLSSEIRTLTPTRENVWWNSCGKIPTSTGIKSKRQGMAERGSSMSSLKLKDFLSKTSNFQELTLGSSKILIRTWDAKDRFKSQLWRATLFCTNKIVFRKSSLVFTKSQTHSSSLKKRWKMMGHFIVRIWSLTINPCFPLRYNQKNKKN